MAEVWGESTAFFADSKKTEPKVVAGFLKGHLLRRCRLGALIDRCAYSSLSTSRAGAFIRVSGSSG